jgi:cytochrome c-type biogenesis protein CcmH/NrfG
MEPQVGARIKEAREALKNDPGSAESWGRLGMVFQAY